MQESQDQNLVEVWGDYVDFVQLLIALALSTLGAVGGYLLAPDEPPKPLIWGLVGVLIAFVACVFLFKPKRTVVETEATPGGNQ
jgi:uncharacterized membrane protein YfcA